MKFSIQNVRKRLGAVGGAALLIFMTQRLGDVLSLMSGLWLVPKHASEVELGAIKPLETVAGMIGMPIAIIVTPYVKALNTHALRGETGKVKALMRDMFVFCAAALA
ncbi:MAG: hypothetical protein FWG05_05505, partial [Kiritimatiellaeota bacterium]|nr:hypothetical protein [Kiritimatiellota bacterium]